jgi:hypothetical protein
MSWLPELLAGPGVNFNSGRRGKTTVLSEGAGVQGAAVSDRGGHGPNCGQRVQHQRRLSRVRRAGIGCRPTLGYGRYFVDQNSCGKSVSEFAGAATNFAGGFRLFGMMKDRGRESAPRYPPCARCLLDQVLEDLL